MSANVCDCPRCIELKSVSSLDPNHCTDQSSSLWKAENSDEL